VTRFTDYPQLGEQSEFYNKTKIWEAARATSAATTFFAPIAITADGTTRQFLDGGLGQNNPINELWIEASAQFCPTGGPLEPRIRVLLSLGTGRPRLSAFGESIREIASSIIAIADETQHTADTFDRMHPELALQNRYFRLNPPDIGEVDLDEPSKRDVIAERCEVYGADPETKRMVARWTGAAGDEQSASAVAALAVQELE
jgi:calcium-independent phospholipase A2-gamma